jgi:pimeloyl-ACP methyl ester carboxylesterase
MSEVQPVAGLAPVNQAQIYYERGGEGAPFVMIHAGVADSRQWENEFAHFADRFQVVRYDLRGFGQSEPVAGDYNDLEDLIALLDFLQLDQPLILMGCSMGGGLAMDFALAHPARVKALIMVGSGPAGLELDVPEPAKFEAVQKAHEAGDLDLVAELETQIWFDGMGRTSAQVDQAMRGLAYTMNRTALAHDAKQLGKRLPNSSRPAAAQLDTLRIPVLVIVGANDLPYLLTAADYMEEKIPSARKVVMADAAHLPNLDHPEAFQRIVAEFLEAV